MYILNIETATRNCSVSIAKNGKTHAIKELAEQGYSHSENLHVFINDLLLELNININQLVAVSVSCGPGSYTGLRIGVSAAKGLCFALKIPLIAIDTLAILAHKIQINEGLIIPMLDARRMEVYSAVYNSEHQKLRATQAEVLTENSFRNYSQNIYFVSDCVEKTKSILAQPNFIFIENNVFPSAKEMSLLSFEKFKNNDFENVAYFEPVYLKEFLFNK